MTGSKVFALLVGGPNDGKLMRVPADLPDELPIIWEDGSYRRAKRSTDTVYVWTLVDGLEG